MRAVARREAGCTLAYLNLVGGQDELVFDGDSIVVDAAGEVLARGPQFREDLLVVDLDLAERTVNPAHPPEGVVHVTLSDAADRRRTPRSPPRTPLGWTRSARSTRRSRSGLGDYVRKNGFRSVLLGVSGGIDSTLVATIAADALGGENVVGISNPSGYSSQHSRDDAEPSSPPASAWTTGSSRSSRWSARSSTTSSCPGSPRRTSRPACGRWSGWG